ncbi:hypothetical protein AgCh_039831 [Apium graveolens]
MESAPSYNEVYKVETTEWLPDDINEGRADYVYWIMSGIGMVNFAYYLICAKFFNYGAAMKLSVHSDPYGN